jgi:hypothetical protein
MMRRWLYRTDESVTGLILRLTLAVVLFPHGAQKVLGWLGLLPRPCEMLLEEGSWESPKPSKVSFPSAHRHLAPEDTTKEISEPSAFTWV